MPQKPHTEDKTFSVDSSANKSLWNYDSIAKNDISRYYRITDECIGNFDIKLKRDTTEKTDKEKEKTRKDDNARYYSKQKRKILKSIGAVVKENTNLDQKASQFLKIDIEEVIEIDEDKQDNEKMDIVHDNVLNKIAYYNKALQESAHNVELWLEFVDFQDEVIDTSEVTGPARVPAKIDKKLSILGKALKANPRYVDNFNTF